MKDIHSRPGIGDCLSCSHHFHFAPEDCVRHQEVSLRLAGALLRSGGDRESARVVQDCEIAFDHGANVRPGIILVRKNRIGIIGKRKLHGAPDLAVEIACECSAPEVLRIKKRIYSELKVQELWIVYPRSETVTVLAWSEIGYVVIGRYGRSDRIRSLLLHGSRIALRGIFPGGLYP